MPLPTFTTKTRAAIAAVVLLAAGGTAGIVAGHALDPSIEMAPMRPVPIRSLVASDTGVVTVRARVAEVFGNKFIADDGTGRALVDLGIHIDGWSLDEAQARLAAWQGEPAYFAPFATELPRISAEPAVRVGEAMAWLAIADAVDQRRGAARIAVHQRLLRHGRMRSDAIGNTS